MKKECSACGGTGKRLTVNVAKYMAGKDSLEAVKSLDKAFYGIRDDDAKKDLIMKALLAAENIVVAYIDEASHYPKEEEEDA